MKKSLSIKPSKQYLADKETIRKGEKTFIEVGLALRRIRDTRSYKCEHKSFEAFCQDEYGWGRIRGHQLIQAAIIATTVPDKLLTNVNTEGQMRSLAGIPAGQRTEALEIVKSSGEKPTATAIREAGKQLQEPKLAAEQINELHRNLGKEQLRPDQSLLQMLHDIREMGGLLESLMGRKHSWSKAKYRSLKPAVEMPFDIARLCLAIYTDTDKEPTFEEALRVSEKMFRVAGKIKGEEKRLDKQNRVNAGVAVWNSVQAFIAGVNKRIEDKLDDDSKQRVGESLLELKEWLEPLLQKFKPAKGGSKDIDVLCAAIENGK